MMGKRLFLALAAGALLFLQFADCMSAMTPDQESMQCCGSTPCTPANYSHDCCKAMVSGQSSNMVPAARASLHAPVIVTVAPLPFTAIALLVSSPLCAADAPEHSPPELYTLHASLLI
jgi:hypothetical protein